MTGICASFLLKCLCKRRNFLYIAGALALGYRFKRMGGVVQIYQPFSHHTYTYFIIATRRILAACILPLRFLPAHCLLPTAGHADAKQTAREGESTYTEPPQKRNNCHTVHYRAVNK